MEVTLQDRDGVGVVMVTGEIDLATAPQLATQLAALDLSRPVIVDLSAVTFIDSSGLNALVQLRQKMQATSTPSRLGVVVSRPSTRRIFEVTGLSEVFALFDTAAEALAAP